MWLQATDRAETCDILEVRLQEVETKVKELALDLRDISSRTCGSRWLADEEGCTLPVVARWYDEPLAGALARVSHTGEEMDHERLLSVSIIRHTHCTSEIVFFATLQRNASASQHISTSAQRTTNNRKQPTTTSRRLTPTVPFRFVCGSCGGRTSALGHDGWLRCWFLRGQAEEGAPVAHALAPRTAQCRNGPG